MFINKAVIGKVSLQKIQGKGKVVQVVAHQAGYCKDPGLRNIPQSKLLKPVGNHSVNFISGEQ
jgi:hypothetical protein